MKLIIFALLAVAAVSAEGLGLQEQLIKRVFSARTPYKCFSAAKSLYAVFVQVQDFTAGNEVRSQEAFKAVMKMIDKAPGVLEKCGVTYEADIAPILKKFLASSKIAAQKTSECDQQKVAAYADVFEIMDELLSKKATMMGTSGKVHGVFTQRVPKLASSCGMKKPDLSWIVKSGAKKFFWNRYCQYDIESIIEDIGDVVGCTYEPGSCGKDRINAIIADIQTAGMKALSDCQNKTTTDLEGSSMLRTRLYYDCEAQIQLIFLQASKIIVHFKTFFKGGQLSTPRLLKDTSELFEIAQLSATQCEPSEAFGILADLIGRDSSIQFWGGVNKETCLKALKSGFPKFVRFVVAAFSGKQPNMNAQMADALSFMRSMLDVSQKCYKNPQK